MLFGANAARKESYLGRGLFTSGAGALGNRWKNVNDIFTLVILMGITTNEWV